MQIIALCRRAHRPKIAKLIAVARLRRAVERGLRLRWRWSPQQITARLVLDYPDDLEMRVSHETIYQSLFVQGRGALRQELTRCLRTGRAQRRPLGRASGSGQLQHMVLISERPAEVEDPAVPGHWEADLILEKRAQSAIGTLVERQTRFVMLVNLSAGRLAEHVKDASGVTLLQKYCSQTAHAYSFVAFAKSDAFSSCSPLYHAVNASLEPHADQHEDAT